jgi:hypothetical protein
MPILIDQWFKGPSPTCESGKYEGAKRGAVRSSVATTVRFDLPSNQGKRERRGDRQAGESRSVAGVGSPLSRDTSAFLVFAMLCSALFVPQTVYSLCFPLRRSIFVVQKLILI